jgi:hypothetical protein
MGKKLLAGTAVAASVILAIMLTVILNTKPESDWCRALRTLDTNQYLKVGTETMSYRDEGLKTLKQRGLTRDCH